MLKAAAVTLCCCCMLCLSCCVAAALRLQRRCSGAQTPVQLLIWTAIAVCGAGGSGCATCSVNQGCRRGSGGECDSCFASRHISCLELAA